MSEAKRRGLTIKRAPGEAIVLLLPDGSRVRIEANYDRRLIFLTIDADRHIDVFREELLKEAQDDTPLSPVHQAPCGGRSGRQSAL